MNINIENLVSISEANQNFSKVARLVDEKGTAVILKNNTPRYILMDYAILQADTTAHDTDAEQAAAAVLGDYMEAFKELAKND